MIRTIREDWRVVIAIVSGGHFFSHFYMLTLPPLFPLLQGEFGLNNTQLGLIVSLSVIGGLIQAPVGSIVDRIGAKWVFVIGTGVTAAGIALIGLGPTYSSILALAVISGVGQSAFHPADYALIDAMTDPSIRGRAFSVHTFSGYAGFAAAPIVVGSLALLLDWRTTLYIVGGVGLLYMVFSAIVLMPAYQVEANTTDAQSSDATETNPSFLAVLKQPGILAMFGFFLIMAFAGKGIQTFTTVLAVSTFGLQESDGNLLLTAFFACGSIGVLAGGILADRYAPNRIIAASLVIGSTVLLLTVNSNVPTGALSLVALFGLIGFFISLVTPSRDRLVSELSASGSMGRSFGIVFTGGTTGSLLGPVILGAIGDTVSITMTFVLTGAVYLAASALAISLGRGWLTLERAPTRSD